MWSKKFWLDLLERSIKAALWSVAATIGADATGTISGVDWLAVLNVAGYAFLAATLAGVLIGGQIGARNSASFLPESQDPPAPRKRKRSDKGHSDVDRIIGVTALVLVLLVIFGVIAS
jgi:hypothetical protein